MNRFNIFKLTKNNKCFTHIPASELPGTKKKSFAMSFSGGEIWFEHLDGMYQYEDAVIDKFLCNIPFIARPSSPSLVAINLDETHITQRIIDIIIDLLSENTRFISRLVFVGLSKKSANKFKKRFETSNSDFAVNYTDDFEYAKQWLISERQ